MSSTTHDASARGTESAREPPSPLEHLTREQAAQIGRELDELHEQVKADLGERDATYIRSVISLQRRLALLGRATLFAARWRAPWALGTSALGLAKILENMEIGHNVLHGQWDWMNDPVINSSDWDWDTASTAEAWKHSHNYIHHTYTNVLGKDKDLGYEIMRIDPHQSWHPVYLLQPLYNVLLMLAFEWGVAFHDMDLEAIRSGEKSREQVRADLAGIFGKARLQIIKDYIAWPFVSGAVMAGAELAVIAARERRARGRRTPRARAQSATRKLRHTGTSAHRLGRLGRLGERRCLREPFRRTASANFTANLIRNVWAYAIIFCGHFPDQTYTFTQQEAQDETRGAWYVRQLVGAANIDGGPLFHVLSGNLGYQVEHHLFPDMPSTRYREIAPQVRALCQRYRLPYNSGPFFQQLAMVQRTILRLAFPGGAPRPKPGPYTGSALGGLASTSQRS